MAPQKEGFYDFRIFSRPEGKEAIWIKFKVKINKEAAYLSLPKTIYEPGEKITVHYKRSKYYKYISNTPWIGMFKSSIPHKDENASDKYDLSYCYMDKLEGVCTFEAPREPGEYDFRMFERSNGKEVIDIKFKLISKGNKIKSNKSSKIYRFEKANYWFFEFKTYKNFHDMQKCAELCDKNPKCKVASFHGPKAPSGWENTCVLRSSIGPRHTDQSDIFSWVKPK